MSKEASFPDSWASKRCVGLTLRLFAELLLASREQYPVGIVKDKCAVMIGNEGNGLTELAKDACDSFIYIEMSGKAESLNAAVAASVIMWEMQK